MSVVTKGDYGGGMTGRPMGQVTPYGGSSSPFGRTLRMDGGANRAGYVKTPGGSAGTARNSYLDLFGSSQQQPPTPTFDDTTPFSSPPPPPQRAAPPPEMPMPLPPLPSGGGGGGGAAAPEMMPAAPAPPPSMQALGARDNPSQILERPSPGVNPMMGMRTRPPSMRYLQARAY